MNMDSGFFLVEKNFLSSMAADTILEKGGFYQAQYPFMVMPLTSNSSAVQSFASRGSQIQDLFWFWRNLFYKVG